jgi:hypothetical protein
MPSGPCSTFQPLLVADNIEILNFSKSQDLSLGYNVQMSKNAAGKLVASNKKVIEVSIVQKGARENCHIRGLK